MRGRQWSRRWHRRWVGVAAVGVVLLAACSGGGDDDASGGEQSGAAADAVAEEVTADEGGEGGGSGGAGTPLAVDAMAVARREVVRTGDVELVVDDVEAAADGVRRAAEGVGGFVADEHVRTRDAEVDVTVRVPAADFADVRAAVAELGDVVEQTAEARDVTAEVVDVETRVGSLRASVARLQGLLRGAGDVAQLAAVEGELARREVELEALLGQQRVLRDQVDLATLQVELSEEERPEPDDDAAGFVDGLRRGWVAAVDGARFGLAALGFLLPVAGPVALVAIVVRWWLRRRAPTPVPAPASGPSAAGREGPG